MKLRHTLAALFITFAGLTLSGCHDESENIIPQPINAEPAPNAVGNEGEVAERD